MRYFSSSFGVSSWYYIVQLRTTSGHNELAKMWQPAAPAAQTKEKKDRMDGSKKLCKADVIQKYTMQLQPSKGPLWNLKLQIEAEFKSIDLNYFLVC